MKKRILAVLMIATMSLSVVACGSTETSNEDTIAGQEPQTQAEEQYQKAGSGESKIVPEIESEETEPEVEEEDFFDIAVQTNEYEFPADPQEIVANMTEETAEYYGECGPDARWYLKDNVLVIKGTGEITDNPWQSNEYKPNGWLRDFDIYGLIIDEGITSICGDIRSNINGAFRAEQDLAQVILPSTLESIGDYAFDTCHSLTSITIPDSVTSIGLGAFSYCISLTDVTLSNSLTTLNGAVFKNCTSLQSITIPDSVTSIKDEAFSGCESLTTVVIPSSLDEMKQRIFFECTALTNITIPDGITTVSGEMFRGCESLTSITLPESIEAISYNAFDGCISLSSINIPDSVTSIGNCSFGSCGSLDAETVEKIESLNPKAFDEAF